MKTPDNTQKNASLYATRLASLPAKIYGRNTYNAPSTIPRPLTVNTEAEVVSSDLDLNSSFNSTSQNSQHSRTSIDSNSTSLTSASKSSRTKRPSPTSQGQASSKKSSLTYSTSQIRNDRLGTLVRQLCEQFTSAESWESFVSTFRGPSYLSTELDDLDHPAAALLRQWRDEGVPANSRSEPWTAEQKDECINHGCHYSANAKKSSHADVSHESRVTVG